MELEQLMARAAQGAGGEFVNAIAYRSEYLQAQGELEVLAKTAAAKQCVTRANGRASARCSERDGPLARSVAIRVRVSARTANRG